MYKSHKHGVEMKVEKKRQIDPGLRQEFDKRLIQQSGRIMVPRARTTRYLNSFVPQAVFCCNNLMWADIIIIYGLSIITVCIVHVCVCCSDVQRSGNIISPSGINKDFLYLYN